VFFLTYLRRELRRRMRQALLIAVGLAIAVGLVVTVTAASAGVSNAQAAVLHSLYGIGTDITVTTMAPAPRSGSSGLGSNAKQVNSLSAGDAGLLNVSSVTSISHLRDVAAVAGGLTLTDISFPSQGSGGKQPAGAFPIPATFSVDGVDLAHLGLGLGPFASAKISSGRSFAASDARSNVAVVDSSYARAKALSAGSTITIANTPFTVIGIVRQPQGGGGANVYIPLGRAQALTQHEDVSSLAGKVSTIYVAATSASDIPAVQQEISKLLPSATVTTSSDLASEVSGSLANAASLASDLGKWLSVAVLIAAFAVASLLTMAAVTRRVRELGTLKALGWRSRRIIAQIMGESAVIGITGAVMGIAFGFGGAALVDAITPKLTTRVAQNPASAGTSTVGVHLAAHVTMSAILLAVVLAIAGALIAGSFGGWRAARLRPADAMAQVG
jgi:putative ABC transport system permease protein